MTTETSIVSEGTEVTLSTGLKINIERLRTRQLFRLLKILSKGAGEAIALIDFSGEQSQEDITATLLAAVLFSVPESEQEVHEFLVSMSSPVGYVEVPKNKIEQHRNDEIDELFIKTFENLEIEDFIDLLSKIVELEAPHVISLGKQLATLLKAQGLNLRAKASNS